MKRQAGLVHKCLLGALLSSVAWAVPSMQALAADQLPVKAPAAVEPIPYWWFHGEVDVGGRFFLNDPLRNGSSYRGQPRIMIVRGSRSSLLGLLLGEPELVVC